MSRGTWRTGRHTITGNNLGERIPTPQTRGPGDDVRAVHVAHLIRGTHTACGLLAARIDWADDHPHPHTRRCGPCSDVGERHNSRDVMYAAAITYRQLDHWIRRGWLHSVEGARGSGTRRTFNDIELAVAVRMGELTRGGLTASVAADRARRQPIEGRLLDVAWAAGRGECA